MPRKSYAVMVVRGQGLTKSERKQLLRGQQRAIQDTIRFDFMPTLGRVAIKGLKKEAPKWTGALHEGIHITGQNPSQDHPDIRIGVKVESEQGFPYLNVTRFGRRAVEAVGRSTPARSYRTPPGGVMGGGQKRPFRARMLSFEHTQTIDPLYRRRVKAYRPGGDWVRRAAAPIRAQAQEQFQIVAEDIQDSIERFSFITGKPTGRGASRHKATVRTIA